MAYKAEDKRPRVERVIRFPNPLYGELRKRAEDENRSVNAQVIVAVEALLRVKS